MDVDSEPRIPNELRLVILSCLVSEDPPRGYVWSPDVQRALCNLSCVDRTWRTITLPYLYRRVAVKSIANISSLLSVPSYLPWIEALALLPGRVNYITGRTRRPNAHDYCIKHLVTLFAAVGPTLDRLFIRHSFVRRYRDCSFSPHYLSCFWALTELVVDSPRFLVPFSSVTWENQGFMNWIPACPKLKSILRLGSNGDHAFWHGFKYESTFPAIQHILCCKPEGLQSEILLTPPTSEEPSIIRQLEAKTDLRVTVVDDDVATLKSNWKRLVERLPKDRFSLEVVEDASNWFIATTLQGTLFDWDQGSQDREDGENRMGMRD